ncbi:hypothetical protein [Dyella tabacisoli]|uniref:Uncharacterized protein n=1 Tax=Dyella tabacisoli TaxID=2282381 RepID=A0A369ULD8_9GAMM|nr:hypothetical protein [Dyella tabacisoli]RDD81341.1 hypothetical protein DVJ77_13720 [Dyella tabacisoli]
MHHLSVVIELVDRHRDQPALGAAPRFRLNGLPVKPLAKPQARYALLDLAPGHYLLDVWTAAFKPYQLDFSVHDKAELSERCLQCALEPGPCYEYPAHSTLIRGRLGSAVRGEVTISADYCSVRGRPRRVQTRCARDQPYTLALPGKLASPTQVTLRFEVAGRIRQERLIAVTSGRVQQVAGVFEV